MEKDILHIQQQPIEPGEPFSFSYQFYPKKSGKFQISTAHLRYDGLVSGWDRTEAISIEVRKGAEPFLFAVRYYKFETEGLRLIVHLENKGERIARRIKYKEEIAVSDQSQPIILSWKGDIHGGKGKIIEHLLHVTDPHEISFSETVHITYEDSHRNANSFQLKPDLRRIEYQFPVATAPIIDIVGRNDQIASMASVIENVWNISRSQSTTSPKRLIYINGIEGTGKTRLVYELCRMAEKRGFSWHIEDAKDRSPLKRMLRRLLELKPDEDNDETIWNRLNSYLPDVSQSLNRDIIYRFISTLLTRFDDNELELLEVGTLMLIKKICRKTPTLLVFENINWTPDGAEKELLQALFRNVIVNKDEPILICATYRPRERKIPLMIDRLKMTGSYYEMIELDSLSRESVRKIIDTIICQNA